MTLYKFGFLSQLQDIHFPSNKQINNGPYNLTVDMTFITPGIFLAGNFIAVLQGGANGPAVSTAPQNSAIQQNGLGYGQPGPQVTLINRGVPEVKSSFSTPGTLNRSAVSGTF